MYSFRSWSNNGTGTESDQICGFTSVMIDASSESFEDNIKITKEVIKVAHPLGVSVEAELGTIGDIKEDSGNREIGSKEIIFTKPEDAKKFVEETGCDTLAIAIGTAHGIYPKDFVPHLEQELLTEIKNTVSIPLVLSWCICKPRFRDCRSSKKRS